MTYQRAYWLRRELRAQITKCIVEGCRGAPTKWSCLCGRCYMRWYINGSFEKSRVELRHAREDVVWRRTQLREKPQNG